MSSPIVSPLPDSTPADGALALQVFKLSSLGPPMETARALSLEGKESLR